MTATPPEDVVELVSVPGLGGLYGRGLARSAKLAAARGRAIEPSALPATRLVVRGVTPSADHLTAYQHLVGEAATDVLPAGFVHVLAFPVATALLVEPGFPLPLLGMVHLANRVTQHRPVRLGEALDLQVHAEHLRPHRSGVSVDVVARASVDDVVVWEGVSTYLAKGARLEGAERVQDEERADWSAPVPTGQWRLGSDVARRYAAVSGDRNPIHTSALAAKAFGFPRTIAHGMYTAARALADAGPGRGDAFTWTVDFHRPVLLPGTVAVRVQAGLAVGEATGFSVVGWDARSARRHLEARVSPLLDAAGPDDGT